MDAIQACLLLIYVGSILGVLAIPIGLTILWFRIATKLEREKEQQVEGEEMQAPKPAIMTPLNPVSSAKSAAQYLEHTQRQAVQMPKSARTGMIVVLVIVAVAVGLMLLTMLGMLLYVGFAVMYSV